MKTATAFLATAAILLSVAPAIADGIISQLPPDGSWVQYDVTGEVAFGPCIGSFSLQGTCKLSSVGRKTVDGTPCRWIEVQNVTELKQGDKHGEQTVIVKLLVPEKYLGGWQNPAAHVLKAWHQDDQRVRKLDLQGNDARDGLAFPWICHERYQPMETKEGVDFATPIGTFHCQSVKAKRILAKSDGAVEDLTQTWFADEVPFGVVAHRFDAMYKSDGLWIRGPWIEWKLSKSGTNAKSKLPN